MKTRLTMVVIAVCMVLSILAGCGGKEGNNVGETKNPVGKETTADSGLNWKDQYDLGIRLLNEGRYEDAILAFTAAIQINPKSAVSYVERANAYLAWADAAIQDAYASLGEGETLVWSDITVSTSEGDKTIGDLFQNAADDFAKADELIENGESTDDLDAEAVKDAADKQAEALANLAQSLLPKKDEPGVLDQILELLDKADELTDDEEIQKFIDAIYSAATAPTEARLPLGYRLEYENPEDGTPTGWTKFYYDENGRKIGEAYVQEDGTESSMMPIYYDANGHKLPDIWSVYEYVETDAFYGCSSLTSLDLSSFVTTNVHMYHPDGFAQMFRNCSSLEYLDISNFVINSDVDYYWSTFVGTDNLKTIVLGPRFRFYGNSSTGTALNVLCTPTGSEYTGNWVRIINGKKDGVSYSPEVLATIYDETMAGTWVWETDQTWIRFLPNGGFTSSEDIPVSSMDKEITMPDYKTTTRPGFVLIGWDTNKEGSRRMYLPSMTYRYSEMSDELGDIILLYAQWAKGEIREYTVEHYKQNIDGKTYTLTDREDLYETVLGTAEELENIITVVSPQTKDYEGFNAPEVQEVAINRDGSTVIEYKYDRKTYNVSFNGNGATYGNMDDLKVICGLAVELPLNVYQKTDSMFMGWNTEADGSGVAYTDGQSIKDLAEADNVDFSEIFAQ